MNALRLVSPGVMVGIVAVFATAWSTAQMPPPTITSPVALGTLLDGVLRTSRYATISFGLAHLAYLGWLALLAGAPR